LYSIGDGNILDGLSKVYHHAPEKFNVVGAKDSVMPFGVLFTGLIINQLYFWGMNQTIIQRALGRQKPEGSSAWIAFYWSTENTDSFGYRASRRNWILLFWRFDVRTPGFYLPGA
jgi:hypothetical protein